MSGHLGRLGDRRLSMKVRLLVAAGILLFSASLLADGLVKFKGWDNSPQGYFMTRAERQQWAAVRTDDEAQRFIDTFLASRGPGFAAEVASRVEQADKHLTMDGTHLPGSKTLRGKLVILLGAPSSFDTSDYTDRSSVHQDNPIMANALSGGSSGDSGGGGKGGAVDLGPGGSDMTEGSRAMGAERTTRSYHFGFASTSAGPMDVTINADTNTGKDRPRGKDDAKRLDAAFEAAAQASIKTK
jgi:GWxTD domain-containing protein